eukprot:scaffold4285_cov122-Alexandrium_tamarense.AAC.1
MWLWQKRAGVSRVEESNTSPMVVVQSYGLKTNDREDVWSVPDRVVPTRGLTPEKDTEEGVRKCRLASLSHQHLTTKCKGTWTTCYLARL